MCRSGSGAAGAARAARAAEAAAARGAAGAPGDQHVAERAVVDELLEAGEGGHGVLPVEPADRQHRLAARGDDQLRRRLRAERRDEVAEVPQTHSPVIVRVCAVSVYL